MRSSRRATSSASRGLSPRSSSSRDEGAASCYTGSIGRALLELLSERGGAVTAGDLESYRMHWAEPQRVAFAGRTVLTRGGLSGIPETLVRFDPAGGRDALLAALDGGAPGGGHTTNLAVVDADGSACVLTTSLGLGSGDFLPGLDLHLNSMLGEVDLVRGELVPGTRMESMMAPTAVFDGEALELAIGAAGGTRLRTALVGVLGAILHGGLTTAQAIDRPRFHPAGAVLHAEPGVDEPCSSPSRRTAAMCGGGRHATTTSVASARSVVRAPVRIAAEAAPRVSSGDEVRAARCERRRVFRPAQRRSRCRSGGGGGLGGAPPLGSPGVRVGRRPPIRG